MELSLRKSLVLPAPARPSAATSVNNSNLIFTSCYITPLQRRKPRGGSPQAGFVIPAKAGIQ
ncbi:MAG: hypothetical protein OJF61_001869 [Rhodanobacteraceae bacterium]|nr:MAG: hypothetical protein OJF61_001869 [Rhodanobacteraceae bacterium]